MSETPFKTIARNRQAFHELTIVDRFEAGIVLTGTEVKSLRAGKVVLSDGWVDVENGEAILRQLHINPYTHGNIYNHLPDRPRKLLLKKRQINALEENLKSKGMTAVPLSVYLKGNVFKVEIGLGRGKKLHDKRESSKAKDAEREIQRSVRLKH